MSSDLEFIRQLARGAGQILMEYFRLTGITATRKADRSVVTEADVACDHWVADAIHARFPNDLLLSEELQTAAPASAAHTVWVIDPLDGTTNFSLGLPIWGVAIARLVNGWPELAALYFPPLNELYSAQSGQGAVLNEQPLRVLPPDPDQPAAFFACCSRTHRRYNIKIPYKPRILGSAAYNLCSVARGMAVLSFEATPKIWDIAAAWLVVREAGGLIEPLSGPEPFPLAPGKEYAAASYPTLAAPTAALLAQGRQQITPK